MKNLTLIVLTLITININAQTSMDTLLFDKLTTFRILSGFDPFVFDSSLCVDASNNTQLMVKYKSSICSSFPEYPDGDIPFSNEEDQNQVWGGSVTSKYDKCNEDGVEYTEEELSDIFITRISKRPSSIFIINMFFDLYDLDRPILGKSEREIYHLGVSSMLDEDYVYITVFVYLPR